MHESSRMPSRVADNGPASEFGIYQGKVDQVHWSQQVDRMFDCLIMQSKRDCSTLSTEDGGHRRMIGAEPVSLLAAEFDLIYRPEGPYWSIALTLRIDTVSQAAR